MIRFTNKYLKPVALFLAIAVLFQCCKIYDKRPITLDNAINKTQLKITTTDGKKIIFSSIYYKNDSLLYGLMSKKTRDTIVTIVPKEQIKEHLYEIGKHGTSEKIITMDGEIYDFDSFYSLNDTLYMVQKVKLKKEILIPIEDIKKICVYNPRKNTARTVFLVLGVVIAVPIVLIAIFYEPPEGM